MAKVGPAVGVAVSGREVAQVVRDAATVVGWRGASAVAALHCDGS